MSDGPRRRTPNVRRSKPERRYYTRRDPDERRKPPVQNQLKGTGKALGVLCQLMGEGWTVELEDEKNPDSLVVVRNEVGHPQFYLTLEKFNEFKNM